MELPHKQTWNSVRTLVKHGGEYCSDGIKSVLGLGIITKDDVR